MASDTYPLPAFYFSVRIGSDSEHFAPHTRMGAQLPVIASGRSGVPIQSCWRRINARQPKELNHNLYLTANSAAANATFFYKDCADNAVQRFDISDRGQFVLRGTDLCNIPYTYDCA